MVSAAWRTWPSVMPQPKLFQLFQPSGGVRAGLPGAAWATGWTVMAAIAASTAAARCGSLLDRAGMSPLSGKGDAAGAGVPAASVLGCQQVELVCVSRPSFQGSRL